MFSSTVDAPSRFGRNLDLPFLVYRGPSEFSTNTDVVPVSSLTCWDVNRYYRDLGISWPYKVSRGDLRKAYLACDGPNDPRKTFVFKALLNREVKARYDLWPMGPMPFWDKYVEAAIKIAAMDEMIRRGMGQDDEDALKKVFSDLGAEADTPGQDAEVDSTNAEVDDQPEPAREIPPFPFSFYLWRTHYQNLTRLSQWQELLISAFAARHMKTRITLGYVGNTPHRWLTGTVGYREVIYLNRETEPDPQVADDIAARVQEMSVADALYLARN